MIESLFGSVTTVEPPGRTTKLLSASNRVFALTDDGVLFARGVDSSTGVLGNNGISSIGAWVTILTNVQDFWVSSTFTLMLTRDNRWFYNGRYVNNTTTAVLVPTEITSSFSALINPVAKLAVGQFGVAILDTSGNLYTMGNNGTGWAFTGNTTGQSVLTLRTETNVKDIAFCGLASTFYIHYNDLSVKGAGAAAAGQLGGATANQTALVNISSAGQAAEEIVVGANLIWFKRSTGWYFLGSNTNGQSGSGGTTGTSGPSQFLVTALGTSSNTRATKLISSGYRTWAYMPGSGWVFSGSGNIGCGTIDIATPPWNGTNILRFTIIPTGGYPILSDPINWVDGGSNTTYFLYNGFIYGCGNATTSKLLPGLGTTSNNLGFRKLNNDFTFVE